MGFRYASVAWVSEKRNGHVARTQASGSDDGVRARAADG